MLGSDNFLYASELYRLYHDAVGIRKVSVYCLVQMYSDSVHTYCGLGKILYQALYRQIRNQDFVKTLFLSIKSSTGKKDPESEKQGFNSILSVLSLELVKTY